MATKPTDTRDHSLSNAFDAAYPQSDIEDIEMRIARAAQRDPNIEGILWAAFINGWHAATNQQGTS